METRNLIKFGKNSYVLTLPSSWIKKNKLEKGDSIFIKPSSNGLIISPSLIDKVEGERRAVITTDGKDKGTVFREILAAYVNNSLVIEVKGESLRNESEDITSFLQSLMSLEIVEQTSDRIVVRDFLRFEDVSMSEIIKRVDNILRVMLRDCVGSFEEDFSLSRYFFVGKFFLIYHCPRCVCLRGAYRLAVVIREPLYRIAGYSDIVTVCDRALQYV